MNHPQITNLIWILFRGMKICYFLRPRKRSQYHYHGFWLNKSRIHLIGPQDWRLSHVGCLMGYCCHKLWQITPQMVVVGCCKKCWTFVEHQHHLAEWKMCTYNVVLTQIWGIENGDVEYVGVVQCLGFG